MPQVDFFALIDESGRLVDPDDPVVVMAIVVADTQDRGLGRLLARIRRNLPTKGKRKAERQKAELKFSTTSDKTRHQVLSALAKQPITLFILVVHKDGASIQDVPENYAAMVNAILPDCIASFPTLRRILIDRHFSAKADQVKLTQFIKQPGERAIRIEYVDSQQDSRIDLADFVAGAVAYAHRHDDTTFEDLVRGKVKSYRIARWARKEKW